MKKLQLKENSTILRGRLLNKEYAKEIRSFQLSNYLLSKTGNVIEDFFLINKRYNKKNNKINWFINIMDGFQTFGLHFYAVTLFFHQKMSIDVFTMNISALYQFSSSLNVIFTELISMMENSYYLSDYRILFLHLPLTTAKISQIFKRNTLLSL